MFRSCYAVVPHESETVLDSRLPPIFKGKSLVHPYDPVKQILAPRAKVPMDFLFSRCVNCGIHLCEFDHEPR